MCSIQVQVLNNFFYFPTFSDVKILWFFYLSGWRWLWFILFYPWERQEGHSTAVLLSLPNLLHPEIKCLSMGRFLHWKEYRTKSYAHFIVTAVYLNLPSRTICHSFIIKKEKIKNLMQDYTKCCSNADNWIVFLCSIPGPKPQGYTLSSKLGWWWCTLFSRCSGGFSPQSFVLYSNF